MVTIIVSLLPISVIFETEKTKSGGEAHAGAGHFDGVAVARRTRCACQLLAVQLPGRLALILRYIVAIGLSADDRHQHARTDQRRQRFEQGQALAGAGRT
jgi:hypothetical protein